MVRPIMSATSFFPSSLTFSPFSAFPQINPPPPLQSPPHLPPPDPPDVSSLPPNQISSHTNPNESFFDRSKKWSSLFFAKPKNAGSFAPPTITLEFKGNVMVPSEDILLAAKEQWHNYLVGFFLDKPLNYYAVIKHLQRHWNPQGGIKVKSNGNVFFFLLSNSEDRNRIIMADPVVIQNKLFIVKPWDINIGSDAKLIKSVPVWVKLRNIPLYAWTKVGICWLAMRVGKFLCMDNSTESLERPEYAKCMVEVSPEEPLIREFQVALPDGGEQTVYVHYLWQPEVCVVCKCFGHTTEHCMNSKNPDSQEEDILNDNGSKVVLNTNVNSNSHAERVVCNKKETAVRTEGRNGFQIRRNEVWRRVTNRKKESFNNQLSGQRDKGILAKNSFGLLETVDDCEISNVELNNERETGLEEGEIAQVDAMLTKAIGDPKAINKEGSNVQHSASTTANERTDTQHDAVVNKAFGVPKTSCNAGTYVQLNAGINEYGNNDSVVAEEQVVDHNEEEKSHNPLLSDGRKIIDHVEESEVVEAEHVEQENSKDNVQASEMAVAQLLDQALFQGELSSPTVAKSSLASNVPIVCDIGTARMSHLGAIRADIQTISKSIQSELASKEVGTAAYLVSEAKVKNFNAYLSTFVLEQLDNVQLDAVSSVLQGILASGKKKLRHSPTVKVKQTPTNPYAHIAAPPAYKERPPDIISDRATTSSNEKAGPKTPVTRSMKKEMLRNLQDDG